MNELKADVVFVGAGPASLAGAIKLKQLLNARGSQESVVVVEKADKLGQHNLSGAVFEADVLGELLPDWRDRKEAFVTKTLANGVKTDETVFLFGQDSSVKLPEWLVPKYMSHQGNYVVSVSEMVNWLAGIARGLGVELYTGFAVKEVIVENNQVKGVKLGDKGLDKDGHKESNYLPGETIEAKVSVFGEGSLGQLSEGLVKRGILGKGKNPPVHAVGVKELIRLPEKNNFGANRVLHTFGFPNSKWPADIYGGGALYSLTENTVAVSLMLGLDWRYADLNPQRELQIFKSHRFIKGLLEGGEVISYGARTLPEGGYYAKPELAASGALVIGDAAGLTSVRKLKGLHYAIKSGMVAAEAIVKAIEKQDFSKASLKAYEDGLADSFVMKDLYAARNYRQVFAKGGLYLGSPLSLIQQWLPGRLSSKPDYEGMRRAKLNRPSGDGLDRLTAVSFSGTTHRENEPSHITFSDPGKCSACHKEFGVHPCEYFCPGEVYRFEEDTLMLSPSNCLHCQTCRVKCPHQIIQWQVPEGGDGPKYKGM
ncbi:MAG: electron-transfer flavoprotein:ubiquinone oxidoreductase [Chloroflexota bacterium]